MTKHQIGYFAAALIYSVLSVDLTCARADQQGSSDTNTNLAEIIVTATRRAEPLERVGESISVLPSDLMIQKGVDSFIDYASTVPNLSFAATGEGSLAARSIALRGVASVGLEGGGTTGFYIDDTPVDDSLDPRVVDLERIEVLRGPQGTLYGARSMGGTVRLITKQPDFSSYYAQGHTEFSGTEHANLPNYDIDGVVNVPLSDHLAFRALGFYQSDAGIFDRAVGPLSAPPAEVFRGAGSETASGGQLAIRYQPADNFSLTPRIIYQRIDQPDDFPYADTAPGNFVQRRPFELPEHARDTWTLSSLTAKYNVTFGTVTSATSYVNRVTPETEDDTLFIWEAFKLPSPIPATITRDLKFTRWAQEVRFVSSFDSPFQLVAGIFYSDTHNGDPFPPNFIPGLNAASGGRLGSDLFYVKNRTIKTIEYAGYTEASYQVLKSLKATAGLRYFENTIAQTDSTNGIAAGGFSVINGSSSQNGITPKFLLEDQLNSAILAYATVAKGYRIGGVNAIPPAALTSPVLGCAAELAAVGATPESALKYNSDSLWSHEAGVKAKIDGTTTINADYFYIDWSNVQQTTAIPCGFSFVTNADKAVSKGGELEITTRPVSGLLLVSSAGYTDARITAAGRDTAQPVGSRLFQVPHWTASGMAEYSFPWFRTYEGFVLGDISYTGSSLSGNNSPVLGRYRPSYTLADFRLGIRDARYQVALYVKNLTNDIADLADNKAIAAEAPGYPRISVNRPRTFGLDIRATF